MTVTDASSEPSFDRRRQAELARALEHLDARDPVDQTEVFARAARTLAPPPAVARVLDADPDPDPDPGPDSG